MIFIGPHKLYIKRSDLKLYIRIIFVYDFLSSNFEDLVFYLMLYIAF